MFTQEIALRGWGAADRIAEDLPFGRWRRDTSVERSLALPGQGAPLRRAHKNIKPSLSEVEEALFEVTRNG